MNRCLVAFSLIEGVLSSQSHGKSSLDLVPFIPAEPAASQQRWEGGKASEPIQAAALLKEGNNQTLTLTSCHKSSSKLETC